MIANPTLARFQLSRHVLAPLDSHRVPFVPLFSLPPSAAAFAPLEATVKVLDLATRRYYAGKVKTSNDSAMEIELPAAARLQAGQRVQFVIAGQRSLVARREMQSAFVTCATPVGARLRVNISPLAESML